MTIRSVIIDDEPYGVQALEKLLKKYCPGIEVTGSAGTIPSAVKLIEATSPQLVFLDIVLPSGSGFEVLKATRGKHDFDVIFTTAYEQYAIKAFRESAVDYLLKPIDPQDLEDAVAKVQRRKGAPQAMTPAMFNSLVEKLERTIAPQRLAIPSMDEIIYAPVEKVMRLEAASNYTDIFLEDGKKYTVPRTLKGFEDQLSSSLFFRIHKSHLINLRFVERFVREDGGYVVLKDNARLPVSRLYRDSLLKALSGA